MHKVGVHLRQREHMIVECSVVAACRAQYAHHFRDGVQDMQHVMWQDERIGVVRIVLSGLPNGAGWSG